MTANLGRGAEYHRDEWLSLLEDFDGVVDGGRFVLALGPYETQALACRQAGTWPKGSFKEPRP